LLNTIKVNVREDIQWALVEAEMPRLAFISAQSVNPKIQLAKSYFVLRANQTHTIEQIESYVNPLFENKEPVDQPKGRKAAGIYALSNTTFFVYVDESLHPTFTKEVTLDLKRAQLTLRSVIKAYEKGTLNEKSINALRGLAAIIKATRSQNATQTNQKIEDSDDLAD